MSYYIKMVDPKTGKTIELDDPNMPKFRSCTMAVRKTCTFEISITYNYSKFYYENIDKEKGIRWIYDKTGEQVIPVLKKAISKLGTDAYRNYYRPTAGNAGSALSALAYFAEKRPDGIFKGD